MQSMQKRGKAPQNHGFTELPRSPALHTPAYPAHLYRKQKLRRTTVLRGFYSGLKNTRMSGGAPTHLHTLHTCIPAENRCGAGGAGPDWRHGHQSLTPRSPPHIAFTQVAVQDSREMPFVTWGKTGYMLKEYQ